VIAFLVGERGGGVGRFLGEIGDDFKVIGIEDLEGLEDGSAVVFNGYFPDVDVEKLKFPAFFFFHGLRALSRRKILTGFDINPINIMKLEKFKRWVRKFKGCLAPSFSMAYACKKFYGIEPLVVHLGLDFRKLKKIENSKRERALLWVGRGAWIKGLDRFIRLVDMTGFEGWVVGVEGVDRKNLKFFGRVEDLAGFYSRAYAVVLSSYFESFSITTLEALYYKTPVLTLKSSGGPWEILQMLGLYHYGFENLEDMARAIKRGIEEVETNLDYFSIERAKERLKQALRTLLTNL